ncbi:MAG: isopentenyl-diphosphate Delta-isomerase [archaeon]|nr:MAG: isopentenyl-diphosphate Delta-isomerase [archaeon]
MEQVILVDEKDNQIGTEEKIKAHENGGRLHRCFSILIFNSRGKLLLQKRAFKKYHCGGLWSNTCCGHPRPGEETSRAACRRLKEEFGFEAELEEIISFIYRSDFKNGLTEWEFDHAFVGIFDGEPDPDTEEIEDYEWIGTEELKKDVRENPEKYTPWFRILLSKIDLEKESKQVFR